MVDGRRHGLLDVGLGLALGLVVPVLEAAQLPPLGFGTARWGWSSWFFVVLGFGLGLAHTLAAVVSRRGRRAVAWGLLATAAPILSFGLGLRGVAFAQRRAYERIAHVGDGVVAAIEEYRRARGRPPASLAELSSGAPGAFTVPGYLDGRRFRYQRDAAVGAPSREEVWVLTGDGPAEARTIRLSYDKAGRFRGAASTYAGCSACLSRFDPLVWRSRPAERLAMSVDLAHALSAGTVQLAAARELLGPPDAERALRAAWSLAAPLYAGRRREAVLAYVPDGGRAADADRVTRGDFGGWTLLVERP